MGMPLCQTCPTLALLTPQAKAQPLLRKAALGAAVADAARSDAAKAAIKRKGKGELLALSGTLGVAVAPSSCCTAAMVDTQNFARNLPSRAWAEDMCRASLGAIGGI